MGEYVLAEGWVFQAFRFALDPTDEQVAVIARQFGGRRFAYNWTVRQLKADIEAFHATGVEADPPSFYGMRKRWNQTKDTECVDRETGEVWWPEVSKEAFADGIKGAVDAYWNWQKSRAGQLEGKRHGFPRFKRKGRDRDRCTFTTGAIRVEEDRRHVTLPRIGSVRTHENTRRLQRLLAKDRAKILAATISRKGGRIEVAFRIAVARPQQPNIALPDSTVGVDVGVRTLATVANSKGQVLEKVENPRPLEAALKELRRLCRQRSRRTRGSRRYEEANRKITKLYRRIADIRSYHIHVLTTRLAKTHGTIIIETLDVPGMSRQKGVPGARARRRGLSDSALGAIRRQLRYKTGWYGSRLVEAERWYPSSKTCHECLTVQDIGWAQQWNCPCCGQDHDRDENAAINLARWTESGVVSPVGAAVKRGADHKTEPRPAGGVEARKHHTVQPRDGVQNETAA